jgi:SagB-type dehydrogenase family enzyme
VNNASTYSSGLLKLGDLDASWVLSLPEGASACVTGDGELTIEGAFERFILRRLSTTMLTAFQRLACPGETVRQLADFVASTGAAGELARFVYHLRHLAGCGLLQISVSTDDGPLLTLVPTSPSFALTPGDVTEGRYALSRFAYVHRVGDTMVLESPLTAASVVLQDRRLAPVVSHLAAPATATEVCALAHDLDAEAVMATLSLLASVQVLTRVADDGQFAEDQPESLRLWEFHDLLFHARSRQGRHDAPYGATYRGLDCGRQPPALREASAVETIPLARPNLEELQRQDPPFARVVEQRRSIREYGREPINVEQLGEFLYRVARVKEQFERRVEIPAGIVTMEFASRPYPTAGALYVLETYVVVHRCGGLDPGMYYHHPLEHRLSRITTSATNTDRLLADAAQAVGTQARELQVLLILSARFPRITWKYSSLAYAAILKDVGVVFQSMYLTATAMNLAPCALGAGNSDVFAKAIGSDYYAETSVGEFVLGSCADALTKAPRQVEDLTIDHL